MIYIQDQYRETNIEKFLRDLEVLDGNILEKNISLFYETCYNLDTAVGIGLDLWGAVLKFPRNVGLNDTPTYISLDDNQYRLILKLLASQMYGQPTIENINRALKVIFSSVSGSAYVVDNFNMEFITFVFNFILPDWLKFVFENFPILPRPAGVGINIIEADFYIFGFKNQMLGSFYRSILYNVGGLTLNYNELENKPQINGQILIGNKVMTINGVPVTNDTKLKVNNIAVTDNTIIPIGTRDYTELQNKPTINNIPLVGNTNINYEAFSDKPKINGVALSGNKTGSELLLVNSTDYANLVSRVTSLEASIGLTSTRMHPELMNTHQIIAPYNTSSIQEEYLIPAPGLVTFNFQLEASTPKCNVRIEKMTGVNWTAQGVTCFNTEVLANAFYSCCIPSNAGDVYVVWIADGIRKFNFRSCVLNKVVGA